MTTTSIDIIPFQAIHQSDIDTLMKSIAKEFPENIFSIQSKTMKEVSLLPTHKYWVAVTGDTVLGTIGLSTLENNNIELKRMFLRKEFRGQGIAKVLLDRVVSEAMDNKVSRIFLGTMTQFKAAQMFYEKNGFIKIPWTFLPKDFPINPVDKVFYKKELK